MWPWAVAALVVVQSIVPAFAANWYVDNSVAASGNGTSWASAWKNFSSVVWGSSGVKAGDTLFISGGSSTKTYTESLTVGAAGTATLPIRIAIDASNPSHNGVVTFSGVAISIPQNYINLDGTVNGSSHITVNNYNGDAVNLASRTGIEIQGIGATNTATFVNAGSANSIKIHNCNISGSYGVRTFYCLGSGSWDRIQVYSNFIGRVVSTSGGLGPDGFWAGNGVSIWANLMRVDKVSTATSDEHPDSVQVNGDYIKIYRNEFINVGDSVVDVGGYSGRDSIYVYNNVFRITADVDSYPEFFRFYNGTPAYVNNIKVINNTFIDQKTSSGQFTLGFRNYGGNPSGTGNEIKNNIFVNCASMLVQNSSGFTANTFTIAGNVYASDFSIDYFGTVYSPSSWVSSRETSGKVGTPAFVSYAAKNANNDLHLKSTDTVARNTGVNVSSLFNTDKDGNPRPATGAWDAGAYQYSSGGGGGGNQAPIVNAGPDATITLPVNSTTLNGSATDPEGATLTRTWSLVSGPGTATFGTPSLAVTTVTFSSAAGNYVLRLTVSDGVNTVSDDVTITVRAATQPGGLTFEAESGAISGPFAVSGGVISQTVDTTLITGGRAVYLFNAPSNGNYTVVARVNAPDMAANSFFVNIDAEPTDPYMTWDIVPVTSGFENRNVSWRGATGTSEGDEIDPKVFTLTAGQHSLIVIGREANAALDSFEIRPAASTPLSPPTNLRVVAQ